MTLYNGNPHEFRMSFHIHSDLSGQKYLKRCKTYRIIEQAFKKGLDAIAITDNSEDLTLEYIANNRNHFTTRGFSVEDITDTMAVIRINGKNIYILRGIEFHRNSQKIGGHLLAIGHKKKIENFEKYTAKDLIKLIHDYGGLAIPAHPFCGKIHGMDMGGMGEEKLMEIKDDVDAIEVFNSQCVNFIPVVFNASPANKKARDFAIKYNLGKVCGSDSHRAQDVALSYMAFPKNIIDVSSSDKLMDSIKSYIQLTRHDPVYQKVARETLSPWSAFVEWAVIPKVTFRNGDIKK